MELVKNIAILAHIDAGKTTLSERILFQGKTIHDVGDVDEGLATLDYLAEERRRGITIEAGISYYNYKKERVNLVDTPGHIDFGSEVDCLLEAIEGGVLVVSGVRGVQTQTLVNWAKLAKAQKPTLIFLNKVDLPDFRFDESLIEIEEHFDKPLLLLSIPCQDKEGWSVIDVVANKKVVVEGLESREFRTEDVPEEYRYVREKAFREIVEHVAELDDRVMESFMEGRDPEIQWLFEGLAHSVKRNLCLPIYCGSAKKSIGVRQLMNGIRFLLPNPEPAVQEPAVAKVIKVRHHPEHPRIYLLKVWQKDLGKLADFKDHIYNVNAETLTPVTEVSYGDICAFVEPREWKIGDEIGMDGTVCRKGHPWTYDSLLHFKVEAKHSEDVHRLAEGLQFFADIEPSMQLRYDGTEGTWSVGAVGEVFFDVLVNRLRDEFGVEMDYGFPRVERRESYQGPFVDFEESQETEWGKIHLKGSLYENPGKIKPALDLSDLELTDSSEMVEELLGGALDDFCRRGVFGQGYLERLKVSVVDLRWDGRLLPGLLVKLLTHALEKSIDRQFVKILIPWVKMKLTAPEEFSSVLVADLNNREAKINRLDSDGKTLWLEAEVPLEKTFGYTTEMRNITRGRGSHEVEYIGHF